MIKPSFTKLLSVITVAVVIGTFVGINFALSDLSILITSNDEAILKEQQFIREATNQSAANTRLVIENLDKQEVLLNKVSGLENQITTLEQEIVTLKAEIVDLKQDLIESKIIISEQRENITKAN